ISQICRRTIIWQKALPMSPGNQFITITESRAEEAGSRVILVNHVSAVFPMWYDRQKDAL
ncbi:MAG: hypothetical protein WBI22_09525, partial [Candidatus Methanoculleus thermohydrogenotrophicum]